MKLIITEEQLKLIIESEKEGKLFIVPSEILKNEESYDKIYNLYKDNKDRKNYIGIKVIGDFDLSGGRYGMKINSSMIKICDELVEVDGYLRVVNNYAINLPKLKRVGEMTLSMTDIRELPELVYVGKSMYSQRLEIKSLPKLKEVGDSLDLKNSSIESLPNLEKVGNHLDLSGSNIKSLPMLEEVAEGSLYLSHTPIKDLGKLKSVGFDFYLSGSQIESLPMLEYVGGILNLKKTPLSKTTTEEELRSKINIERGIYL